MSSGPPTSTSAVDIEANDFQPVYAIQSGYATVAQSGFEDTKVTVGDYTYWHISPKVRSGQYVVAYKTELGAVEYGFGHIAFSEGSDDAYLNPLRPGGPLRPYADAEAPVIGVPEIFSDGRVIGHAFDPQSFIHKTSYLTPVLAPAALAWRLYDARVRAITPLEWALNSSGYISPSLKPVIFAPGAANPGFECFFKQAHLYSELGLQPRGRTDGTAAIQQHVPWALPTHDLRVGFRGQHIGA